MNYHLRSLGPDIIIYGLRIQEIDFFMTWRQDFMDGGEMLNYIMPYQPSAACNKNTHLLVFFPAICLVREIVPDHLMAQLSYIGLRSPSELFLRLGRISQEKLDL